LFELLEAKPPPSSPYPDHDDRTDLPVYGNPQMNADGTVRWIVPVSVTLGVGQSLAPKGLGGQSGHATTTDQTTAWELPVDDPNYRLAKDALKRTEGLVYYSEKKDKQARDNYYPDLDNLDAATLYDVLSKLLGKTHTTVLSYKKARFAHLYPWIDRRDGSSRQLRGIYSNKVFDALEIIRQEAEMERRREKQVYQRVMSMTAESVDEAFLVELEAAFPFNCEHVVPQSWFDYSKQPKTDLHHLFTCEWGCNSFRGNRAYFDFQTEAWRDNCGESGSGKFEPKLGKGAVARSVLYFLLRYPGEIADNSKEMPKDRLATIITWANQDKVDRWERHRNAEIQKVQGNRNPLIDYPDLVDQINFELGWA
jgi:endonuclease I